MATNPTHSNPFAAASATNRLIHRDPWTPETSHANSNGLVTHALPTTHSFTRPSDPKSPAAISARAFFLGIALGISIPFTILPLLYSSPFWRPPFFLFTLSLFHFLEYYTTARFNPSAATTSAFLLSQNGSAYNVAHMLAFLECSLRNYFFPSLPGKIMTLQMYGLFGGLVLIVIGQMTRTMAMAQAGTNFSHLVQSKRKEGHVLVTDGVYAWIRHPSYFGFWWWGLGTQLVLGNMMCLVGYTVVLWRFFKHRIEKEEELLVDFFGAEYVRYRKKTSVGIPFIS